MGNRLSKISFSRALFCRHTYLALYPHVLFSRGFNYQMFRGVQRGIQHCARVLTTRSRRSNSL
jgi:hypothetical protein